MDNTQSLLSFKSTKYLFFSLLFVTIAGIFASRTMGYAPSLFGLFFIVGLFFKNRAVISFNKNVLIFIGLCLSLILLSIIWAPDTAHSIEKFSKILIILLFGSVLINTSKFPTTLPPPLIIKLLLTTFAIGSTYLIVEQYFFFPFNNFFVDYQVQNFQLNRSFVIFSAFALMILLYLKNHSKSNNLNILFQIIICAISLASLYLCHSQTAQITFLCGLFFIYLFPIKSIFWGKILFAVIIVTNFTLPFILIPIQNLIPQDMLLEGILREASIIHRFEVWEFTITEIKKSLLWGHGIDAQRFLVSDKWMIYQNSDQILHAHNVVLQVWIEFGIIGAILLSIMTAYFYKIIFSEKNLQARSYLLVTFTSLYCCFMTGFGIWQSWQLGLVITMSAFATLLSRQHKL